MVLLSDIDHRLLEPSEIRPVSLTIESGGEVILDGVGGQFFIGPNDERWDHVLLVRQRSLEDFFAFASNPGYLSGLGHRTAALEDSRLLAIESDG